MEETAKFQLPRRTSMGVAIPAYAPGAISGSAGGIAIGAPLPVLRCVRLVHASGRRSGELVSSVRLARMRQSVRLINRDAVAIKQPQGTHRSTL